VEDEKLMYESGVDGGDIVLARPGPLNRDWEKGIPYLKLKCIQNI